VKEERAVGGYKQLHEEVKNYRHSEVPKTTMINKNYLDIKKSQKVKKDRAEYDPRSP